MTEHSSPVTAGLYDANQKDAEEFCNGAFGPFGVDTEPYTKIVAELMQHATDRALASRANAQCAPWQPIETAPKDGQDIILLSENGIRVAHWMQRSHPLFTGWFIPLDGSLCSGGMYANRPTHWMPLPEGPPVTSTECLADRAQIVRECREAALDAFSTFGSEKYVMHGPGGLARYMVDAIDRVALRT